jgi:hypothetical protein
MPLLKHPAHELLKDESQKLWDQLHYGEPNELAVFMTIRALNDIMAKYNLEQLKRGWKGDKDRDR